MEAGLLASVGQNPERYAAIQVAQEDWVAWGELYRFMGEHLDKYQALPTPGVLLARFPDWVAPDGEYGYWAGELRRLILIRRAQQRLKAAISEIEQDPELTIQRLANDFALLGQRQDPGALRTDVGIGDRLAKYQLRKDLYIEHNGRYIHGIPTGLQPIDETGQGWMPGELVGMYARPGVGKSWKLVHFGVLAWANARQYRVLLISPEMPARQMALRVDVLMANQLGIPISHRGIYRGDPRQEEAYKALVGQVQQHDRFIIYDSIDGGEITLSGIAQLYRQHRPDLILIDGVSLLRDEDSGETTWHEMKNLCYGLKRFATATDAIVIISHQAKRGDRALGKTDDWIMPSLSDAAYGDAFVQACSTVVTMCADREEKYVRWYAVPKSREREIEDPRRQPMLWRVDAGQVEDYAGHTIETLRAQLLAAGGVAGAQQAG